MDWVEWEIFFNLTETRANTKPETKRLFYKTIPIRNLNNRKNSVIIFYTIISWMVSSWVKSNLPI